MQHPALSVAIHAAHLMADAARRQALNYYRTPLEIITKEDASPVTMADRNTEAAMRAIVAQHCPQDGIYGEEYGQQQLDAAHLWVIDPIDGTRSFITASPLWGTLIAWLDQGTPALGLMDLPVLNERWFAVRGGGASCNGRPQHVSACRNLHEARISTTSPDIFSAAEWSVFDALSRKAQMRRFGGDCYSYAQLAGGHIDAVIESGLQPYDYMAHVCIIEEAGGIMTDWHGNAPDIHGTGQIVVSATEALHQTLLQALAPAAR